MPLLGLFGPPNVEKLKAKRDVQGLIKALGYQKDVDVRRAAAEALGQMEDERAVEPLATVLNDENFRVQEAAVEALVHIWRFGLKSNFSLYLSVDRIVNKIGTRSVTPLIAALRDQDSSVRNRAATRLGEIGDLRAVEPLAAALKDKEEVVRTNAAAALVKIGDSRAAEPLLAALEDESKQVRAAAEALGNIGHVQAVSLLVAALSDEDHKALGLPWQAKTALVKIGEPSVNALIATLKDDSNDSKARSLAAEALGQIKDKRAVEELAVALRDENENVAWKAAEALQEVGDGRAVEALAEALKSKHSLVRNAAVGALGKIKDTRAVEPLIATLKDKTGFVRKNAVEALNSIGWQPMNDAQRALRAIALGEWEEAISLGSIAVDPLVVVLDGFDREESRAAAEALGRIGDARASEALVAALSRRGEVSSELPEAVAEALERVGDARAVKPLVAILKNEQLGGENIREIAANVLRQILTRTVTNIAPDDLRAVANIKDGTRTVRSVRDGWWAGDTEVVDTPVVVDYSDLRRLAQQELIRRGLEKD